MILLKNFFQILTELLKPLKYNELNYSRKKISEILKDILKSSKRKGLELRQKMYDTFAVKSNQEFMDYVSEKYVTSGDRKQKYEVRESENINVDSNESSFFDFKESQRASGDEMRTSKSSARKSEKTENLLLNEKQKTVQNVEKIFKGSRFLNTKSFSLVKIGNTLDFEMKLDDSVFEKKKVKCKVIHLFVFRDFPNRPKQCYSDYRVSVAGAGNFAKSKAEERYAKGIQKMGLQKWLKRSDYQALSDENWKRELGTGNSRIKTSLKIAFLFGMTLGVFYLKRKSNK